MLGPESILWWTCWEHSKHVGCWETKQNRMRFRSFNIVKSINIWDAYEKVMCHNVSILYIYIYSSCYLIAITWGTPLFQPTLLKPCVANVRNHQKRTILEQHMKYCCSKIAFYNSVYGNYMDVISPVKKQQSTAVGVGGCKLPRIMAVLGPSTISHQIALYILVSNCIPVLLLIYINIKYCS